MHANHNILTSNQGLEYDLSVIHEGRQRAEEDDDEEEEALRRERRSKRRNDRATDASEQRPRMARIQFEKLQVDLTEDLLGRMIIFDDPKLTEECKDRVERGKKLRSERRLKEETLKELGSEAGFLEYITGIGFDWLLEPCSASMPIELAQEFFTTFQFTHTTDVGAESICFRLFTQELRMSVREWSVRLGLYTADQEVEWFERDIGPPKNIKEYDEQAAWAEMVPRGTAAYKPTDSRADCIEDPVLRLAQVFLGVNLLCQANTFASLTEAELYFMWCMMKKRKVHLGYWLARTCQAISSRASRNLNGCHILGAIVTNCVVTTTVGRIHKMTYCPNPELFGSQFLMNVEVAKKRSDVLNFYTVTRPESQPVRDNKKKNREKQGEVVAVETENDATGRTEAAPFTLHTQEETAVPPTSAAPELSPEHASLVELAVQQDEWRARMEGLMERIALNTDRLALQSEAQTQLLTSQTKRQRTHDEDVRTAVFAVRDMVSLMANMFIPQRQRDPHHAGQGSGSRRPAGRDDPHPRGADSRRDQPWR